MTITVNPRNKKELKKIKAILKAIDADFWVVEEPYNEEFVKKIQKSREEIENGETRKIPLEDLWK